MYKYSYIKTPLRGRSGATVNVRFIKKEKQVYYKQRQVLNDAWKRPSRGRSGETVNSNLLLGLKMVRTPLSCSRVINLNIVGIPALLAKMLCNYLLPSDEV